MRKSAVKALARALVGRPVAVTRQGRTVRGVMRYDPSLRDGGSIHCVVDGDERLIVSKTDEIASPDLEDVHNHCTVHLVVPANPDDLGTARSLARSAASRRFADHGVVYCEGAVVWLSVRGMDVRLDDRCSEALDTARDAVRLMDAGLGVTLVDTGVLVVSRDGDRLALVMGEGGAWSSPAPVSDHKAPLVEAVVDVLGPGTMGS